MAKGSGRWAQTGVQTWERVFTQVCRLRQECTDRRVDWGKGAHTGAQTWERVLRQVCTLGQEGSHRCADSGKSAHTGVQNWERVCREHKRMISDFKSLALQHKLTVFWATREHS